MKSWKTPTPDQVSRAIALFGQVGQYRYFFDRLQNPLWIVPLKERGYFGTPPPPEREDVRGTIAFPPWPESQYLARMAPLAPNAVAQIMAEVPVTENLRVHEDLIDAALGLPAGLAAAMVSKATSWLQSPYHSLLPQKIGVLIAHLANGGQIPAALELARALLEVAPDPRFAESTEEGHPFPPEPRGRFDLWDYQTILRQNVPPLVATAGMPAIALLCDVLERAISLSQLRAEATPPEDYSYVWRPAIENHGQNLNVRLTEALVVAVRDAVEQVARQNATAVPALVDALEARPWRVFHRMALHLLRLFSNAAPAYVAARLTNRELFEDIAFRHEYALLLENQFSTLDPPGQQQVLSWIEEGPDLERYRAGMRQWRGTDPNEADCAQYAAQWRRDRMALFGDSLPASIRGQYQALVAQQGPAEHPEFASYQSGVLHGPTSPTTPQELRAMSAQELAGYLRAWVPTGGFTDPTPEGLGRELTALVSADPTHFAVDAGEFRLEEPTYVRSILRGLCEAASQGRGFDWIAVLQLCRWAAQHPRQAPGDRGGPLSGRDPHWGWTRKSIAELLSAGFAEGPMELPTAHRETAWQILSLIVADPDPTPDTEAEYSQDPATLAINTTRGEAINTVVKYALWLRRGMLRLPEGETRARRGFDEMPEVRAVLDERLNAETEPSPAIRSVYGQWFPWLVLLDAGWARQRAGQIFPVTEESRALWNAAWNTYIRFCAPYDETLRLLQQQYRHAVDRLSEPEDREGIDAPQYRLAEHLMTFYWRGKLVLDDADGLLTHFYARAPLPVRAHAIAFIGRSLYETKEPVEPVILERLRRLWAARVSSISASAGAATNAAELSNFGWWFASGKFDNDWGIAQLKETLRLSKKAELDAVVVERLAALATDVPAAAVECLTLLVEADEERWAVLGWAEHVKTILSAALRSGDANAKALALRLIDCLGALGRYEFRELLALGQ